MDRKGEGAERGIICRRGGRGDGEKKYIIDRWDKVVFVISFLLEGFMV